MSSAPRHPWKNPPDVCPVCGEDVPPRALACPECGADDNSGWRDDHEDEESFNYDEFVEEEFGSGKNGPGIRPLWVATAVILLAVLFWWVAG